MSSSEKNDNKPVLSAASTAEESRRKLLKKLAAGGVAGAALPAVWSKPVIDSVVLPVHAQTTGVGVIVGGGGGGGTGPGPAPLGSMGRDLIDFFVNPAEAGENSESEPEPPMPPLPRYCVEISVRFDGSDVTEVTVTKYCIDSYNCAPLFFDITEGSVKLTQSGNQWKGTVDKEPMTISSINLGGGGKLANVVWGGIPGVLNKGASCDCSCAPKMPL